MGRARKERKTPISPVEHKLCWMCRVVLPAGAFAYSSTTKDGLQALCGPCNTARLRAWAKKNQEHVRRKRHEAYLLKDKPFNKERYAKNRDKFLIGARKSRGTASVRLAQLVTSAKSRSAKNGLEFNLDRDWLMSLYQAQDGCCLLTGFKLTFEAGSLERTRTFYPLTPSLDRIDPSKGYIKDNTRLVCTAMNLALNSFGEDFFAGLCKAFLERWSLREQRT